MKKWVLLILTIICCALPFPSWIYSIVKSVQFSANCADYLELSAEANSIVLAERHLTTAIDYLEKNEITSGQARFIVKYPKNDIGLWYENLKTAQSQLQQMIFDGDYNELEQSNMLMKLRETLLDGEYVVLPLCVSLFPNGTLLLWLNTTLCVVWILGGFMCYWTYEEFDY